MSDGPNIARIAGLVGEPARAEILAALMGGQALTATELATLAGITRATASAHLARLLESRLVSVEAQGRHRYFRLAGDDVAELLEGLMGVAQRAGALRLRPGPREPALRKARVCYDHLAGELGVLAYEALCRSRVLRAVGEGVEPGRRAREHFATLGIDLDALARQRRPLCRSCLDWSMRRRHLAGALGAALLERCLALGWARRVRDSRVVQFSPAGERDLRRWVGSDATESA